MVAAKGNGLRSCSTSHYQPDVEGHGANDNVNEQSSAHPKAFAASNCQDFLSGYGMPDDAHDATQKGYNP